MKKLLPILILLFAPLLSLAQKQPVLKPSKPTPSRTPSITPSNQVLELRKRREALIKALTELRKVYNENSPEIKQLKASIAGINSQIKNLEDTTIKVVSLGSTNNNKSTDKAKDIILKARFEYLQGVNFFAEKKPVLARAAFDKALAILLTCNVAPVEQPQITAYYEQLQDSIYYIETGKKPPPKSISDGDFNVPLTNEKVVQQRSTPKAQIIFDDSKALSALLGKTTDLEKAKQFNEAVKIYDQLIKAYPDNAYFYLAKARNLLELRKFMQARTLILKSLTLEQGSYAYSLLGKVHEKENNLITAKDAYWKSLKLEKGTPYAFDLESLLEKQKDIKGLILLHQYLIERGQKFSYNSLAELYDRQNLKLLATTTRQQGINFMENIINSQTVNASDFWILSSLYLELENREKAISLLNQGITRFPTDSSLTYSLVNIYIKNNNFQFALDALKKALLSVEGKSQKRLLLLQLVIVYKGLGQSREAAQVEADLAKSEK